MPTRNDKKGYTRIEYLQLSADSEVKRIVKECCEGRPSSTARPRVYAGEYAMKWVQQKGCVNSSTGCRAWSSRISVRRSPYAATNKSFPRRMTRWVLRDCGACCAGHATSSDVLQSGNPCSLARYSHDMYRFDVGLREVLVAYARLRPNSLILTEGPLLSRLLSLVDVDFIDVGDEAEMYSPST